MRSVINGEFVRLAATRLPLWTLLTAVLAGGLVPGLISLIGPENATPPMPAIDTADGAAIVLGLGSFTLFVPALIGTIAISSEYRHRTIGSTFLAQPRRPRVLIAKLVAYAVLGTGYGVVSMTIAAVSVYAAATLRGTAVGAPLAAVLTLTAQLAAAAAIYMLLGVAIGALAQNQIVAIGITLGYFYFLEYIIMILPGVNAIYPMLPGGATAALTRSTFLSDALASQISVPGPGTATPVTGALILIAYAVVAAGIATLIPLRRDIT